MNKPLSFLFLLFLLTASAPWSYCQHGNHQQDGDEAMEVGFYKTAYDHYLQAALLSPDDMQLIYKIAEACRLSNDYVGAIENYAIVLQSKVARSFPDCHYYLAGMYRCNGQYDSALVHYETYMRTIPANATLSARARQELRACQWILDGAEEETQHYWVQHESKNINTSASESGALRVAIQEPMVLYSTITSPGNSNAEMSDNLVIMQTYQALYSDKGKPGLPLLNEWGINSRSHHSGNVAIDTLHHILFFTRSNADNNMADVASEIYYITWKGKRFSKAKKVDGNVNLAGYTSTQPTAGLLPDSSLILYFSSNRPGGMGGSDIWYTILDKEMNPSPCVNLGYPVNSPGNEITPFYSNEEHRLYFSSDWHYGFGGYDVFYSLGQRDTWQEPKNAGRSLNSPANDLYYNQDFDDPYKGYLTSNRSGSDYQNGNTCCNDIYRWSSETVEQEEQPQEYQRPPSGRRELIRPLLPIALYFDNDCPDPKSKSPSTKLNYFQTYNSYMFRRGEYQQAQFAKYTWEEADSISAALDNFFDNQVQGNCKKFEKFLKLLGEDLRNGRRIRLTIEGYASPLHSSNYNFTLSKRRIATIINQIMDYNHGELLRYMGHDNGGSLQLNEVAYGSSHADAKVSSDRSQQQLSVYSVDAARERRIEIQDYTYLEDDSTIISCLSLPNRSKFIGTFRVGQSNNIEVHLPHTALFEKRIDYIHAGLDNVTVSGYSTLKRGKELIIYLSIDNRKTTPTPSTFLPLTLRVEGENVTQTLFLEYSITR